MRLITLTNGKRATVDDRDYQFLSQWTWGHVKTHSGDCYAARGKRRHGKYHKILMHVEIAKRAGIYRRGREIDHRNRKPRDNRRRNLRSVTRSANEHNSGVRKDSTTGHRGISINEGRYTVRLQRNKRRIWIGQFRTLTEAKRAYAKACAA
jgi:hypothetical protein